MLFHTACPFSSRAFCQCPYGPGGAAALPLLDASGAVVSSQLYATKARQLAAAWANPDSLWSDCEGVEVLVQMPPPLPPGLPNATQELRAAVLATKRRLVAACEDLSSSNALSQPAKIDAGISVPVAPPAPALPRPVLPPVRHCGFDSLHTSPAVAPFPPFRRVTAAAEES